MINLNKPLEKVDYTVTPLEFVHDDSAWQVQLLTGDYKGKNLVFTNIEYNGSNQTLRFLLDVLDVDNNLEPATSDLEDYAFEILEDIIKKGIADGSILLNDQDSSN